MFLSHAEHIALALRVHALAPELTPESIEAALNLYIANRANGMSVERAAALEGSRMKTMTEPHQWPARVFDK